MTEREEAFLAALESMKELAKEQGNVLTTEQVEQFVTELKLEQGQVELIYQYLKQNKIGVDTPVNLEEYLTQDEFDYLTAYLEELKLLEQLTDGQKRAVFMSALAGDADAKKKVIEIFLPQVVEIAKLYTGQGIELTDLIGEGNVALAMGVEMLGCVEQPEEIDGMLAKLIMDAMEEFITEEIGEQKKDSKVLSLTNKVAKASEALAKEVQRKVTVEELARETGLKEAQIREAIRISAEQMEYIEVTNNANHE